MLLNSFVITIISLSSNHPLQMAFDFIPSGFWVYITTAKEFFACVHLTHNNLRASTIELSFPHLTTHQMFMLALSFLSLPYPFPLSLKWRPISLKQS